MSACAEVNIINICGMYEDVRPKERIISVYVFLDSNVLSENSSFAAHLKNPIF